MGNEITEASARGDVEAVRSLGERYQELQEASDRLLEEWVAPESDR